MRNKRDDLIAVIVIVLTAFFIAFALSDHGWLTVLSLSVDASGPIF
jgi:hypothetical protein